LIIRPDENPQLCADIEAINLSADAITRILIFLKRNRKGVSEAFFKLRFNLIFDTLTALKKANLIKILNEPLPTKVVLTDEAIDIINCYTLETIYKTTADGAGK